MAGGITGADDAGLPVIFDPACYFGDREAYPLDEGYALRKVLYNLYHVLNHLNLFGRGYLAQAEGMIDRLLAEIA